MKTPGPFRVALNFRGCLTQRPRATVRQLVSDLVHSTSTCHVIFSILLVLLHVSMFPKYSCDYLLISPRYPEREREKEGERRIEGGILRIARKITKPFCSYQT